MVEKSIENPDRGDRLSSMSEIDIDLTKSTQENYSSKSASVCCCIVGDFVDIRKTVDSDFHGYYEPERQLVQDAIIRTILGSATSPSYRDRPKMNRMKWTLFSSGPMGARKRILPELDVPKTCDSRKSVSR